MKLLYPILLIILIVLLILSAILISTSSFILSYNGNNGKHLIKKGGSKEIITSLLTDTNTQGIYNIFGSPLSNGNLFSVYDDNDSSINKAIDNYAENGIHLKNLYDITSRDEIREFERSIYIRIDDAIHINPRLKKMAKNTIFEEYHICDTASINYAIFISWLFLPNYLKLLLIAFYYSEKSTNTPSSEKDIFEFIKSCNETDNFFKWLYSSIYSNIKNYNFPVFSFLTRAPKYISYGIDGIDVPKTMQIDDIDARIGDNGNWIFLNYFCNIVKINALSTLSEEGEGEEEEEGEEIDYDVLDADINRASTNTSDPLNPLLTGAFDLSSSDLHSIEQSDSTKRGGTKGGMVRDGDPISTDSPADLSSDTTTVTTDPLLTSPSNATTVTTGPLLTPSSVHNPADLSLTSPSDTTAVTTAVTTGPLPASPSNQVGLTSEGDNLGVPLTEEGDMDLKGVFDFENDPTSTLLSKSPSMQQSVKPFTSSLNQEELLYICYGGIDNSSNSYIDICYIIKLTLMVMLYNKYTVIEEDIMPYIKHMEIIENFDIITDIIVDLIYINKDISSKIREILMKTISKTKLSTKSTSTFSLTSFRENPSAFEFVEGNNYEQFGEGDNYDEPLQSREGYDYKSQFSEGNYEPLQSGEYSMSQFEQQVQQQYAEEEIAQQAQRDDEIRKLRYLSERENDNIIKDFEQVVASAITSSNTGIGSISTLSSAEQHKAEANQQQIDDLQKQLNAIRNPNSASTGTGSGSTGTGSGSTGTGSGSTGTGSPTGPSSSSTGNPDALQQYMQIQKAEALQEKIYALTQKQTEALKLNNINIETEQNELYKKIESYFNTKLDRYTYLAGIIASKSDIRHRATELLNTVYKVYNKNTDTLEDIAKFVKLVGFQLMYSSNFSPKTETLLKAYFSVKMIPLITLNRDSNISRISLLQSLLPATKSTKSLPIAQQMQQIQQSLQNNYDNKKASNDNASSLKLLYTADTNRYYSQIKKNRTDIRTAKKALDDFRVSSKTNLNSTPIPTRTSTKVVSAMNDLFD